MKTTKMTPMVQIDEQLKTYNPVNENLSVEKQMPQPSVKGKVFSTADLWRLRRQSRLQGLVIR
jgi:hypothetical protein